MPDGDERRSLVITGWWLELPAKLPIYGKEAPRAVPGINFGFVESSRPWVEMSFLI